MPSQQREQSRGLPSDQGIYSGYRRGGRSRGSRVPLCGLRVGHGYWVLGKFVLMTLHNISYRRSSRTSRNRCENSSHSAYGRLPRWQQGARRTGGIGELVTPASFTQDSMENSRLMRDSRVQLRYGTARGRAPGLFVGEGVAWLWVETRALEVHARPPQRLICRRGRKLLVLPQHVSLPVYPREFSQLVELPFGRFCRSSAVRGGRVGSSSSWCRRPPRRPAWRTLVS